MLFTSLDYGLFLLTVFVLYWSLPWRRAQNGLLLAGSYLFYGWVHPWFCLLIATSTLVDYACGLGMERRPQWRRTLLWLSLLVNVGLLGFFKYYGFFVENLALALEPLGLRLDRITLEVFLPAGISFYTFQTLSYTIDVYRGHIPARRSLLDFAVFVSFFPQLVAGPIERASRFLPQVERARRFTWAQFSSAWPLIARGYFKKLVVADNLARWADRVYLLEDPSTAVFAAGALTFSLQVYADFSAYTDIARGSARLIGFELMENFRTPYLSRTLPEFWARWHISLMTWIRDYIYIPLGGSRVGGAARRTAVLLTAFLFSGLWHGAAWNYVLFGLYHGCFVEMYRRCGLDRKWNPASRVQAFLAWGATFFVVVLGMSLFRTPDVAWWWHALLPTRWGFSGEEGLMALILLGVIVQYCWVWLVEFLLTRRYSEFHWSTNLWRWVMVGLGLLWADEGAAFVYFQF